MVSLSTNQKLGPVNKSKQKESNMQEKSLIVEGKKLHQYSMNWLNMYDTS